eukprot:gene26458-33036_t
MALWGDDAEKRAHDWNGCPIVSVQAVVVKEFRGKFLSLTPQSILSVDVLLPETDALRSYRDKHADGNFPVTIAMQGNDKVTVGIVHAINLVVVERLSRTSLGVSSVPNVAEILLGGVSAESLRLMRENNLAAYDKVFDDCVFQSWICKVKVQYYEHKVKCTIIGLAKAKLELECSEMESELRASAM